MENMRHFDFPLVLCPGTHFNHALLEDLIVCGLDHRGPHAALDEVNVRIMLLLLKGLTTPLQSQ